MDQEYSRLFYTRVAPVYDWVFGKTMEEGRREAARQVQPGDRVLEVGVGTGLGLRHYPSGCEVLGIDICRRMLRKARWRALVHGNGSRVQLRCMDATDLQLPDDAFDVVVAPYVITTVGNPAALCAEMRRVCRPGGRVVVVSNTRETGVLGAVKGAASPVLERFGFCTNLDVAEVLGGAGLALERSWRVNWGIHKVFVARKPGGCAAGVQAREWAALEEPRARESIAA